MIKVNSFISRNILKATFRDSGCFSSWMRKYISPKELYFIKKNGLHKFSIIELSDYLIRKFNLKDIVADYKLIEYLIRVNTKLGLIINLIRAGYLGNFKFDLKERNKLLMEILSYRIICSNKVSLGNIESLLSGSEKNNSFTIYAPVCPDYSYVLTKEGRYIYTFESIGSGIGLVAQKAIFNLNLLEKLSSDLTQNGLDLNFKILIGDFEASQQNLNALNQSKTEFLSKVSQSCDVIESETGINTLLFTDLCNGLEGWNHSIQNLKYNLKINNFEDLEKILPHIKHEKKLISRLPLYQKWFGKDADFKEIFLNQVLEYILMGKLIVSNYFTNPILLASDHKAMKDYYNSIAKINVISSSANY